MKISLLIVLHILVINAIKFKSSCDEGWFQYRDKKCIKYADGLMTFEDGQKWCKSVDAKLLTIRSSDEQRFISILKIGRASCRERV